MTARIGVLLGAALVSALLAAGQGFLKSALSDALGGGFVVLLRATLMTWKGWMAISCTGTAALFWLKILAKTDLAVAYPLISLSYLFGFMIAIVFFKESVTLAQWGGTILICAGVALVNFKG